jgi:hypothetical protein
LLLASLIGETASRARQRIKNLAKAKTVTAAEVPEGAAGAVFDLASKLGLVSDQRAANGGVMAGVKKAKTDNLTHDYFMKLFSCKICNFVK